MPKNFFVRVESAGIIDERHDGITERIPLPDGCAS
jgi:hypothetical protein